MSPHSRQLLNYASPRRGVRCASWLAIATGMGLALACVLLCVYQSHEEPFLGRAKTHHLLLFRVLPYLLPPFWCAWAILAYRWTRPRVVAVAILAAGIPIAVVCCREVFRAHRNFEMDQAVVAEWYRLAEQAAKAAED